MIHQLREAFPEIEVNCLTTITNKHTFVFENQILKKGVFVNDTEKYHLHIENKTNSYFYFVQNDDCVMKKKADNVIMLLEIIKVSFLQKLK